MREDVLDGSLEGVCPAPPLRGAGDGRMGIVVIGRNEGRRLERCLDSVLVTGLPAVYVDSGSSDGSPELARSKGLLTEILSPDRPYTAARARNAGRELLRTVLPEAAHVQFVDGDCELAALWPSTASAYLDSNPDVDVVAGQLRERHPEASLYNRLCEMEWHVEPGEAEATGGLALMRSAAFDAVGGFREGVVAGEEGDLCFRLRQRGSRIMRIDAPMATHDAGIVRFSQWWTRAVRFGHAAAQNRKVLGLRGDRPRRRSLLRALFWGLVLPASGLLLAALELVLGRPLLALSGLLLPLAGWSLLFLRVLWGRKSESEPLAATALYALFIVLAKPPEALGALRYALRSARGRPKGLIEYKRPA